MCVYLPLYCLVVFSLILLCVFEFSKIHEKNKRFEFIDAVNDRTRCVLVLEVQKSMHFHYAIIHNNLKSWERLNASNMSLNEQPQVFVKRITELRNELEKMHVEKLPSGFIRLAFCDEEIVVNEQILQKQPDACHKKIFRFDLWCQLDRRGRFMVDRPVKYFKMIYEFLCVGYVSMLEIEYPIFLVECDYYGVALSENNQNCVCMVKNARVTIMTKSQYEKYLNTVKALEQVTL